MNVKITHHYFDTYIIDIFILVAYPCFLAFGKPSLNQQNCFTFEPHTYFQIFPNNYEEWIKAFKRILKLSIKSTIETIIIYESNDFVIKCQVNNENFILEAHNSKTNQITTTFELNLYQITAFFKGIDILFFKPFAQQINFEFFVDYCCSTKMLEEIENLSYHNIFPFITESLNFLHFPLKLKTKFAQLMLRYKPFLIQRLLLKRLNPLE